MTSLAPFSPSHESDVLHDGLSGRSCDVLFTPLGDQDDRAERALAEQIRAGNDEALAELFYKYAPALAAFADGYVRDSAIAEELVQDAFLWIIRNRTRWLVRGTIRSYLYGTVRNYALDHLKHQAIEQRWATLGDREAISVPADAMSRLVAAERVSTLATAIARLAESRRTALILRWERGLSYAEIATILGSSTKAVENQLNRTLRQLRDLLGE